MNSEYQTPHPDPHIISRPYSVLHKVYYRDRVSSFETWPVQLLQDKHSLASARFYYTNKDDLVKCFSCGLRLGDWLKDNNVWKDIRDGLRVATILTWLAF